MPTSKLSGAQDSAALIIADRVEGSVGEESGRGGLEGFSGGGEHVGIKDVGGMDGWEVLVGCGSAEYIGYDVFVTVQEDQHT